MLSLLSLDFLPIPAATKKAVNQVKNNPRDTEVATLLRRWELGRDTGTGWGSSSWWGHWQTVSAQSPRVQVGSRTQPESKAGRPRDAEGGGV